MPFILEWIIQLSANSTRPLTAMYLFYMNSFGSKMSYTKYNRNFHITSDSQYHFRDLSLSAKSGAPYSESFDSHRITTIAGKDVGGCVCCVLVDQSRGQGWNGADRSSFNFDQFYVRVSVREPLDQWLKIQIAVSKPDTFHIRAVLHIVLQTT